MPLASTEYSEAETKMFEALGFGSLLPHLAPYGIYRVAIEDSFIKNRTGLAVESLRRTAEALATCKIYRTTPEFDQLIILE